MSAINDGGPAFPQAEYPNLSQTGMSLRDYFAAKAMQGFLAGHIGHHGHESHWPYERMASEAVDVADAMLKALEGGAA